MKIAIIGEDLLEKEIADRKDPELAQMIYSIYNDYKQLSDMQEIDRSTTESLIKEIIIRLFKKPYSEEITIPFNFLESEVGKLIFTVKYCNPEKVYGSAEVAEMLDCTLQNVNRIVKSNQLRAFKEAGRMYFYESDIIKFAESKDKTIKKLN